MSKVGAIARNVLISSCEHNPGIPLVRRRDNPWYAAVTLSRARYSTLVRPDSARMLAMHHRSLTASRAHLKALPFPTKLRYTGTRLVSPSMYAPIKTAENLLPTKRVKRRPRNVDVAQELPRRAFEALEVALAGFSKANRGTSTELPRVMLGQTDDHLYAGLLTLLLRLVFLLYCESWGLLPMENPAFVQNYSVRGLFEDLRANPPDTMHLQFGASTRLEALFRVLFFGIDQRDTSLRPHGGQLFDPQAFPFLARELDDATLYVVLEKLLYVGGRRIAYETLDVEQIGYVYEALMGFSVRRIERGAIRMKLTSKKGAARVWVEAQSLLSVAANERARWLQVELSADKGIAKKIAETVTSSTTVADVLSALERFAGRTVKHARPGMLVLQPGPERRKTGSHYTPRTLTEPIVARTLDPLIAALGENPTAESLLQVVVCDPAVGSGAFLVAACRYMADHLVAAWRREGVQDKRGETPDDVVHRARRIVAQHCLVGVDKNTYAVQLARLSLWLVSRAKNEPFTFVDHAIRQGDSLVGLHFEQIRAFHWNPRAPGAAHLLSDMVDEALALRRRNVPDALDRVRLVADLVVGAFFSQKNDRDREKERLRRLDRVTSWLEAEKRGALEQTRALETELRAWQSSVQDAHLPFHWEVEFPNVFASERSAPVACIGNPPFKGGSGISSEFGEAYRDWLLAVHEGAHGNSDIVAHFFRRAAWIVGTNGGLGFIATNTIGQGDTRSTGLQHLVHHGFRIHAAETNRSWPGEAAVTVSVVHLVSEKIPAKEHVLDSRLVPTINSTLRPSPERLDPVRLMENAGTSFLGSKIYGQGFVLTPDERDVLIARESRNAERIFPYLGGEEVNTSPTQAFGRYVIHFGQMSLEEANTWPDLMHIVRRKVKPERDKNNRDMRRANWWRFGEVAPTLYAAIAPLSRCLVNSQVSKHLIFAFQPTNRVFAHTLYAYCLETSTALAILQSRIHEPWAWLLSSTMRYAGIRYTASDCFETFPFPAPDPRTSFPVLESMGEMVNQRRSEIMLATNGGLTSLYNALKDPSCVDERIVHLRRLHEDMDRAVLDAYGWSDLDVPPYCACSKGDRIMQQRFEEEVIDRLYVLNARRAAEQTSAR